MKKESSNPAVLTVMAPSSSTAGCWLRCVVQPGTRRPTVDIRGQLRHRRQAMRSLASALCVAVLVGCSGAPQAIVVKADRSSAVANGTDAVTLTATSTAADGTAFPDVVEFTVSAGGQLSATSVKSDAAGVATTKLTATTPGTLTVTATAGPTSGQATVVFASSTGPRLRFQTSPSNTAQQNLLRPIPAVVVEDASGVVTASSAAVTVVVTPGSCSASIDPSSLSTVNALRGVASFNGLKLDKAATGCTLTATSGTMPSAVSSAFDIQ